MERKTTEESIEGLNKRFVTTNIDDTTFISVPLLLYCCSVFIALVTHACLSSFLRLLFFSPLEEGSFRFL
jgi:hypothetical protein